MELPLIIFLFFCCSASSVFNSLWRWRVSPVPCPPPSVNSIASFRRGNGSLMMSVFAVCSLPEKFFVDRMIIFICLYHSLLPDDLRASIGQNGVTTDHILVLLLFSLVGLQQPLALEGKSSMPTSMSALSPEQLLSGSFRKWRGNGSLMMSVFLLSVRCLKSFSLTG